MEAIKGLFVQVLALCRDAGMVKLGHVALDGTKMKAEQNDHDELVPMVDQIEENTGHLPDEVSADTGYCSEAFVNAVVLIPASSPSERHTGSAAQRG